MVKVVVEDIKRKRIFWGNELSPRPLITRLLVRTNLPGSSKILHRLNSTDSLFKARVGGGGEGQNRLLSSKPNGNRPDVEIKTDKRSFQVINFLIAFVKHAPCWKLGRSTSF